ncbi:terminase TerL endonuclease subunit [Rhodoferax ferrireducens]|uniref:terminase large subunit n=1 Tax=Rhodoferax ferrireducens TaxID=192843 RepID=UPI00298E52A2|nr:terminase TerL endonuclease subunit [Rhodoferax ferrireducens]WPC65274.1 terminase TerL endonuclease subunit [Rhodoferax ferrireducens]
MTKTKKPVSSANFVYDKDAAVKAVAFFSECLTHTTGEWRGKPFVLSPWQAKIVGDIFGWKRIDGTRKFRTVFIAVPRKAGKTTLAAGLALYALFCDNEPGAQVINAAADREQAALCFDAAKGMVQNEAMLEGRSEVFKRSIIVPNTGSVYKVISSEAYSKHGLSCSYIGADELHAWPDRELWDVLNTSTGARRQPLTVVTTTAGYDRHSICYEIWDYAVKVRDGIIQDESFLPVIFAADVDDDWQNPATWRKAHPGLGVSVQEDYFAAECAKAQAIPAYENTFRRLLLNQWTESDVRWMSMDAWDKCGTDLPDLTGRDCYAGLDLSTTTDITALVLAFPIDGTVHLLPFFWVPSEGILKRSKRDRVPYDTWAKQGQIEVTDGTVIDYDVIRKRINELSEIYHIKEIAIDRWNATQLATQLAGDGFDIVAFGQGYASMSGPTKELEKIVLGEQLNHGKNPVLRWMASNVSIEQDAAGNIKASKAKSTERIDGIIASIMALGRVIANAEPVEIYASGEFSFI